MLATTLSRRTVLSLSTRTFRSASTWSAVAAGPPDPILGMYAFSTWLFMQMSTSSAQWRHFCFVSDMF
jgi:hypothetical protein